MYFDIYEIKYNTRHAYYRIEPAVKSIQPHDVNELVQSYKNQLLTDIHYLFLCSKFKNNEDRYFKRRKETGG